jgi:hypothetical protein
LAYAEVKSTPAKPASFVAVKIDQKSFRKKKSSGLKVVIGVRGTKTAANAITDLLCDSVDYQGGKAHSFILTSGKFLAETHYGLLLELLEQSGASKIDLTLIGHSLGAGAATDPDEVCALQLLSSKTEQGKQLFTTIIEEQCWNVIDLLRAFPSTHSKLTIQELLRKLPGIPPQYYSVSSSPIAHKRLSLTC